MYFNPESTKQRERPILWWWIVENWGVGFGLIAWSAVEETGRVNSKIMETKSSGKKEMYCYGLRVIKQTSFRRSDEKSFMNHKPEGDSFKRQFIMIACLHCLSLLLWAKQFFWWQFSFIYIAHAFHHCFLQQCKSQQEIK